MKEEDTDCMGQSKVNQRVMKSDAPVFNRAKRPAALLLTGWSLVRIRPGEPILNKYLTDLLETAQPSKSVPGNIWGNNLQNSF